MRGQKSSILLGRRTKTDVLKNKVVRKDDDGQDCFEDYWTDSDNESTVFSRSNWTFKSDSSKANLPDSNVTNQSLRRSHRIIERSQKEFSTVSSSQPGITSRSGSSKTIDESSEEKEFHEPSQVVKSVGLSNEISRVLRSESKNKSQKNLSLSDKKIHRKSVVIPDKTSYRKNVSSAELSKNSLSRRETNINKFHHSTSAHSRPVNEASSYNDLPPNSKSFVSETETLASTHAKRQVEPSTSKGSHIITPAKTTYRIDESSPIPLHYDSESLFSKSALASKHSNHQVGASIPDNSIRAAGTSSVKTVADYSLKGKHLSKNAKEVGEIISGYCELESVMQFMMQTAEKEGHLSPSKISALEENITRNVFSHSKNASLNKVPKISVEQQLHSNYPSELNQSVDDDCSEPDHPLVSGKNTSSIRKGRKVSEHHSQIINSKRDALPQELSKSRHKHSQLSTSNYEDVILTASFHPKNVTPNQLPENSVEEQMHDNYPPESRIISDSCLKPRHSHVSEKNASSMRKERQVIGHHSRGVNSPRDSLHQELSYSKQKPSQIFASNQEEVMHNIPSCSDNVSLNQVPEKSNEQQFNGSYFPDSNQSVADINSKSGHPRVSEKNTSSVKGKKNANRHHSQGVNLKRDSLHPELSKSKQKSSQILASNQDVMHNVSGRSDNVSWDQVPENSNEQQLHNGYFSDSNQSVTDNCSKSGHSLVSGKNTVSLRNKKKVNEHHSHDVSSMQSSFHQELSKSRRKPSQISASNQEDVMHKVYNVSDNVSLNQVPENSNEQQLLDNSLKGNTSVADNRSKSGYSLVSGKKASSMRNKRKVSEHHSQGAYSKQNDFHQELSKSKRKTSQISASNQDVVHNISSHPDNVSANLVSENPVRQQLQKNYSSEGNHSVADNSSKSEPPLVSGKSTSIAKKKRKVSEHHSQGFNSESVALHRELSKSKQKHSKISASNQDDCHMLDLSINPNYPVCDLSRCDLESGTSESSGQQASSSGRGREMKDVSNVCETERSSRKGGLGEERVADQAENHCVELPEKKTRKRKLPKSVEKPTVAGRPVRTKRPPLAHWRNERVLYRYENGEMKILGVQEGTTEDKTAINAILKKSEKIKKKDGKGRIKVTTGSVYDAERDKKVSVKLVTPFHAVPWDVASPSKPYRLKKMLNTGTVSFGYLEIQGLETKGTQYMPTEDLHMVVIQGRVQFRIQENKIEVGEKDMVIVPKCVAYSITNLENRKALLYFSVGRFKYLDSCGVT